MKKTNVIVVFGGDSVEHDISIITGVQVLNNLNKERFNIFPIYLSKRKQFYYSKNFFNIKTFTKRNFLKDKKCFNVFLNNNGLYKKGLFTKLIAKFEFAFLATHGGVGENGGLQGFFETINMPYSSCGILSSAIGMNKWLTKCFLKTENLPYVTGIMVFGKEKFNCNYIKDFSLPLIVKPCSLGSSVGISYCRTKSQVKNAVSFAKLFDNNIIIEKSVENLKEVNIAVLGNEYKQEVSDIEEVLKTDDILSFENKYLTENSAKGMENTNRVLPAKLDSKTKQQIEDIAVKVFKNLGCRGVVRFDFLINSLTNEVFLNEFNTIPGSFANYLWQTKKYSFSKLLDKIFDYCTESYLLSQKKLKNFSSSILENISNNIGCKFNK